MISVSPLGEGKHEVFLGQHAEVAVQPFRGVQEGAGVPVLDRVRRSCGRYARTCPCR
jgi:hypothetical protein